MDVVVTVITAIYKCQHFSCPQYFTKSRHATFNVFRSLPLCGILFLFQGHAWHPSV